MTRAPGGDGQDAPAKTANERQPAFNLTAGRDNVMTVNYYIDYHHRPSSGPVKHTRSRHSASRSAAVTKTAEDCPADHAEMDDLVSRTHVEPALNPSLQAAFQAYFDRCNRRATAVTDIGRVMIVFDAFPEIVARYFDQAEPGFARTFRIWAELAIYKLRAEKAAQPLIAADHDPVLLSATAIARSRCAPCVSACHILLAILTNPGSELISPLATTLGPKGFRRLLDGVRSACSQE